MRVGFLFLIIFFVAVSVRAENTKVIVGCDYNYPPYSYFDKNGKAVGYDIDVINALGRINGWEAEFQLNQWDSVLTKLDNGETDIVTSIIYSESREKIYDFSFPLHTEYYYIFAKESTRISDVNDLEGKVIAKLEGDVSNDMFLEPLGLLNEYKTARSLPEAVKMVNAGECDYVIAPYPLAMEVIEKNRLSEIVAKGNSVFPSVYCFAVKQGNDELLAQINKGIQELTQSGELNQIYDKWVRYRHQEDRYQHFLDYTLVIIAGFGFVILILLIFWRSLRKQVESKTQQIKDAERVYRDIFNSAIDSLVIFDNKGYIMDVNKETMRVYGMTYEQMVGSYGADIISPENKGVFDAFMKIMNSEGYFHAGDVRKSVNSHLVHLNIRGVKVFFNGKERFLVVLRDVTKEQDALIKLKSAKREAESANKTKSTFLSTVSHEIRTPLNAIIGYSNLMAKTNLDKTQTEYNKKIHLSGEVLLNLVNDILDITKIEAEKLELKNEPFSIKKLVNKIKDIEFFKAKEKGLEVNIDISDSVPDILVGDEVRLSQVILNILNNAIKFTDEGVVSLTVDSDEVKDGRIMIFVTITDSGIGISKEKQDKLFNAFEQVHDSKEKKYGGTGLGLAISKQLIAYMNGNISIESKEGQGSTFRFNAELGVYEGDDFVYETTGEQQLKDIENLEGVSALLVEDNEFNAEIFISQLGDAGCKVRHVISGFKAIEAVQESEFDIVLMDIEMPGMNGFETSKEIRKINASVPIIALSAHMLESDNEKVLEAGMNACINKPVKINHLIKTINKNLINAKRNTDIRQETQDCVNVNDGLSYFAKDLKIYKKALESFYANYNTLDKKLEECYHKNRAEIKNYTHNIKSGAKLLGANELHIIASQCDDRLRKDPDSFSREQLSTFIFQLDLTLRFIRRYLDTNA